ncbi:MAG: hypothetical protein A2Y25_08760 [Candidatus Melainabacteria bacterium GWF2_37_15]|nr:MAG: hypothetical protein A2Y25_08760 [Candidatus Melainabacteria bacterium GWF2_37_15]
MRLAVSGLGKALREFSPSKLREFKRGFVFRPNNEVAIAPLGEKLIGKVQELSIKTADGIDLNHSYYIPPAKTKNPFAIAFFHGNASPPYLLHDIVEDLVKIKDKLGIGTVMPCYRGFGGNKGIPSEKGIYEDARATVRFLKEKGVPPQNIISWGLSLGGVPATKVANKSLIAHSTYSTYNKLMPDYLKFLQAIGQVPKPIPLLDRLKIAIVRKSPFLNLNPEKNISKLGKDTQIGIFHSKADEVIPYKMAEDLAKASPNPKLTQLHIVEDGTHRFASDKMKEDIFNFIKQVTGR